MDPLNFAQLLNARLCHDLAGPIGATATGAELLAELGDAETIDMVATSAQGSADRLRLLRLAFGPTPKTPLSTDAARTMAERFLSSYGSGQGSYSLIWDVGSEPITGPIVRVLYNLLVIGKDALPLGGQIRISLDPFPTLKAMGASASLADEVVFGLKGNEPDSPKSAQAWLTQRLAINLGGHLKVECLHELVSVLVLKE